MSHLLIIFERLHNAGLTIKARKCQFGMATCVCLGHMVGGGSFRPEQVKVEATRSMPVPRPRCNYKNFQDSLVITRSLYPQYSTVALPLTDLTKKHQPTKLEWTRECARAFQQLKELLCSDPVLLSLNFDREFVLQTDASNRGIGVSRILSDNSTHYGID